MLFEETLATSANRAIAVTGGPDGLELLEPPHPVRMGTITIRSESAIFLTDIRVLVIKICKPQSRAQSEIEAFTGLAFGFDKDGIVSREQHSFDRTSGQIGKAGIHRT